MWWIPGPWLELPPHILRAMDSTVRQDNSSSLELHCRTVDDCDRKVIKSGFKISKLNSVLFSSALSPTHASTAVRWSHSWSAQLVEVCLMTPGKDFSTSPLSPGHESSLANRCYLGRLGQWREGCPQSFDLSSCFFLSAWLFWTLVSISTLLWLLSLPPLFPRTFSYCLGLTFSPH